MVDALNLRAEASMAAFRHCPDRLDRLVLLNVLVMVLATKTPPLLNDESKQYITRTEKIDGLL